MTMTTRTSCHTYTHTPPPPKQSAYPGHAQITRPQLHAVCERTLLETTNYVTCLEPQKADDDEGDCGLLW